MSLDRDLVAVDGHALPAVSWSAVFAGVAAALAAALTLDLLGAGFGFALAPPGLATHASLAGFTPAAGAWAVAAEVVALALGGYVAGRMRAHWRGVHADEAHFRDTAHGLLVWAVTTVVGAALTALVLAPYAASLSAASAPAVLELRPSASVTALIAPSPGELIAQAQRAANIAAQASFFGAVGLFLGAFIAAVAAALGGLQRDAAVRRDLMV